MCKSLRTTFLCGVTWYVETMHGITMEVELKQTYTTRSRYR